MRGRRWHRRVLYLATRPVHPLIGSIMGVRTEQSVAALTFDDGPDDYHTMRILEQLALHGATATFFVLAQRAAEFPRIIADIRDGGHEIGLHGDDHSPLIACSTRQKIDKIIGGKRRLESVLGREVRLFRPAYGLQDIRSFVTARLGGLHAVGWTASGSDWLDVTPAEVAERAARGLERGGIVLLHDRCEPLPDHGRDTPGANLDRAAAVKTFLERAASQDIELVSVGTLLTRGVALRRPWFGRPV